MSDERLASRVVVSAFARLVAQRGGNAAVIARGDERAGAILILLSDRGHFHGLLERVLAADGAYRWSRTGPQALAVEDDGAAYIERRLRNDPDLWILELDIAGVEQFAAEMTSAG